MKRSRRSLVALGAVTVLAASACGASDDVSTSGEPATTISVEVDTGEITPDVTSDPSTTTPDAAVPTAQEDAVEPSADAVSAYQVEVWADNWMAVAVDGVVIGEDSVSITTERSFNSETFTFEASLPFTIAIEVKDFKENDSGLEYIGESNQQMGDGGIIAQVTDLATGDIVAVTDSAWAALVVHQAPLDPTCENDPDPVATCEFHIVETPTEWTQADFDDSGWADATEWSAADVSPKGGYDEIDWDPAARFIWGTDLEIDNTVLLRTTVG